MPSLTNSRIVAAYRERTPGSASLASEAGQMFPSGITHDSRHLKPYGIFVERGQAPGNGTSMATNMSTITAATARCCWAITTRP